MSLTSVPFGLNAASEGRAQSAVSNDERLARLVTEQLDFVWRSLRRLGVPSGSVDDAAQQLWLIVANKLPQIAAGSERAFLFGTALRIASEWRRRVARQREAAPAVELVDGSPGAEELVLAREARLVLDQILDALPDELRVVFILYELEEQTAAEIAELLGMPPGTVASRLRRARVAFQVIVKRFKGRQATQGGK